MAVFTVGSGCMTDGKNTPARQVEEEIEEIEVLDDTDGIALPDAGASAGNFVCCSSSCCSAS